VTTNFVVEFSAKVTIAAT